MQKVDRNKPIVAFDEYGNTGGNLLDKSQPVFALASVRFLPEEIRAIRGIAGIQSNDEIRFRKLQNSASGREKIVQMLRSGLFTPDRVKVCLYHKRYMAVAKVVDILVETLAYDDGRSIYLGDRHVWLSDLIYAGLPASCGNEMFDRFLQAFVNMVRTKDDSSVEAFYACVRMLKLGCMNEWFLRPLDLLAATERVIDDALLNVGVDKLDPAIPTFDQLARSWTEQLGGEFEIIHDETRALERVKTYLEMRMSVTEPVVRIAIGNRTSVLPIRADGIRFANSKESPEVQMADLVAGAAGFFGLGLMDDTKRNGLWEHLETIPIRDLIDSVVWPSM